MALQPFAYLLFLLDLVRTLCRVFSEHSSSAAIDRMNIQVLRYLRRASCSLFGDVRAKFKVSYGKFRAKSLIRLGLSVGLGRGLRYQPQRSRPANTRLRRQD